MDETPNPRARGSVIEIDNTKALRLGLYCASRPKFGIVNFRGALVGGCIPKYISYSKPYLEKLGAGRPILFSASKGKECLHTSFTEESICTGAASW